MTQYLKNAFIIIIFSAYGLYAEENVPLTKNFYKPLVVTLVTYNEQGDTLKDFFTYDEKGNLLTQTLVNATNGGSLYLERKSSTYDENGNRLSYIEEERNGIRWDTLNKTINTYTNFGRVATEFYERFEWGYWGTKKYYTYDERNRLVKIKEDYWTDNNWLNDYNYSYSYDIYGNLEYETMEYIHMGQSTFIRYYNIYDFQMRKVQRLQEKKESWDSLYRAVDRYFYNYTNNKLTSIKFQNWYLNVWNNRKLDTITYNNSGKIVEYLYKYNYDNNWKDNYRRQYTYDYSDNLITQLDQQALSFGFTNNYYNIYSYDEHGNCISGKCKAWAGSQWNPSRGNAIVLYNNGNDTLKYDTGEIYTEYIFFTEINDEVSPVNSFSLEQNYPNPFNPSTTINYQIQNESLVTIKVYDILGKEVTTLVNENKAAGKYSVSFDAKNLSSGVYLYQIKAGSYISTKKMMLLR
ncbi:MAG TPA: T9SS type A sorting domain-containing protein [Melioribacteraceae bacterium]|nr:T9SS type A sorting domain-containing protein [Melioribacteraceae bacterium]